MELIIEEDFSTMTTKIYGKVERRNQTCIIGYDGKHLIEQALPNPPVATNYKIKPLLIIPHNYLRDIVAGFAEYAQKQEIRTANQNILEGKLIATEKHLLDMKGFDKKLMDYQLK